MPHDTHFIQTPGGLIFHLEITPRDFLSIDARGSKDVFSWTADCQARCFLDLGRGTSGIAKVAIDGERLDGAVEDVLAWTDRFPPSTIDAECDFVRFEWNGSSLTFQVFVSDEIPPSRVSLVSMSGAGLYLRTVQDFVDKTGTDAVIREIDQAIRVGSDSAGT
ncbi:hypothetical protein PV721_17835 [Streptomyces sp. MB09-01]|uniref:hypothetical protein n=1 Tax=Streptomyces sp. MB09-01 TaxID=3028666 RepID=UPI0029AF009C|nr:hypothetical protein [Streptomyces sp. MB09-01]MDX3536199.1 hypothetical protein [Streptomyces sp. MB09-01]